MISKIWYTILLTIFGKGTVIYTIFLFDKEADASLPGHYTTSERYMVWVDYLGRKSRGKKCTFEDVENEYIKKWQDEFEKVRKKYNL